MVKTENKNMPLPEKHKCLSNTNSIVHQELNVLDVVRKDHEEHMHLPGVCGLEKKSYLDMHYTD